MSDGKRFGRRRRGMHFKPSSTGQKLGKNQEREAQQARADAVNDDGSATSEGIYERSRYQKKTERSENVAAGLPPEGPPPETKTDTPEVRSTDFRTPNLDTPAQVTESYEPLSVQESPPQNTTRHPESQKHCLPHPKPRHPGPGH